MQQDNPAATSRSDSQSPRLPRSIDGLPVAGIAPPEYARPALPSWALLLLALALILPFLGRARDAAQAPRVSGTQASLVRLCGPGWQVRRIGAGSYVARTSGMAAGAVAPSCALPIDPGVALVLIHLSGDSAAVSTDLTVGGRVEVPAGGWWQVPVDRAHRTLVVTPDPHGGDASVTIDAPDQFPSADLP